MKLIKLLENASTLPSVRNRYILCKDLNDLLKDLDDLLKNSNFLKKLAGPLGIGKSTLLFQAVSYAMCKPWIVIYIPNGKNYLYNFLFSFRTLTNS